MGRFAMSSTASSSLKGKDLIVLTQNQLADFYSYSRHLSSIYRTDLILPRDSDFQTELANCSKLTNDPAEVSERINSRLVRQIVDENRDRPISGINPITCPNGPGTDLNLTGLSSN